jgi:two-component system NtrC family sensor kinase
VTRGRSAPGRRTVAARILYSYLIVLCLFAGASTWSVIAFREAVSEAALLRQGYLPLALSLRNLVADQDTYNSQLNHVTTAKNPSDVKAWFDSALALGRPKRIQEVRQAIVRALSEEGGSLEKGGGGGLERAELLAGLAKCESLMSRDEPLLKKLFAQLGRGEEAAAQVTRDALVRQGLRVQKAILALEARATSHVDGLVETARERERTILILLLLLGGLTVLVGALMAFYARRVLAPLSHVTARADAVAAGDLTAQKAVDTGDEIGELSATFEGMVQAIGEAREKLLASERLAAIGKMAAHVTHEVRNPLSSIALNLELLEEELGPGDAEARTLLRAIGQEVERLSGLSDQYLSMARRKAPEVEESDLGAIVHSAIEFMRPEVEKHRVELVSRIPPELPWVLVDQGQIRQVLFNLVRNAREAMPGGGRVSIEVNQAGEALEVRVSDNGPGVPPEQIERLFDPFYTTKDHGTGLGLAVSRQILAAHGGRLEYAEARPHGSVFALFLPLRDKRPRRDNEENDD